jgi:hypothetical protein
MLASWIELKESSIGGGFGQNQGVLILKRKARVDFWHF